jgi:hypothetical protein
MTRIDQIHSLVTCLAERDVKPAIRRLIADWFVRFGGADGQADHDFTPASFGVLEPYVAQATVLEGGADFLFNEWGDAMSIVCGGNRLGHRLSVLPQPSRSHLRRVCVRATASRSPALSRAIWVLGGDIWRCTILALPMAGDDLSVRRLLVALLFVPHPILAADTVPEGFGWPAAILRGSVHRIRSAQAAPPSRRLPVWRTAASAFRRLLLVGVHDAAPKTRGRSELRD